MTVVLVILAAGTMLVLATFMAYVLGWANKAFHVTVDPRQEAVLEALPGVNCGGCGYVGCSEYAEAVVAGSAPVDKCPVGGAACAAAIAEILGVNLEHSWPMRPIVHCGAGHEDRLRRTPYRGEPTCAAAGLIPGVQGCTYGCLGLGDCQVACGFDAIHIADGLAVVDYDKCVGCGACQRACPRQIISMEPFKADQVAVVACSNLDFGKDVRAVCKTGCIGCKACQRVYELFAMQDNLPRVDYEKYDPQVAKELDAAVEKCPTNAIVYVGKASEEAPVPAASQA